VVAAGGGDGRQGAMIARVGPSARTGLVNVASNELVLFHQKIENRSHRCTLGFLISWNGSAETVTEEMLREAGKKRWSFRSRAKRYEALYDQETLQLRCFPAGIARLICEKAPDAESALAISAYRPPAHSAYWLWLYAR
jgi:hypothetical protein